MDTGRYVVGGIATELMDPVDTGQSRDHHTLPGGGEEEEEEGE